MKAFKELQRNFGEQDDFYIKKSHTLEINHYYDLVVDNEVISVQIVDELPGMVLVKGENYQKWLHRDTDALAKHKSLKKFNSFVYYNLL